MENELMLLLIPFAITLVLGVPIAFSLGLGASAYLLFGEGLPLNVLVQQMYNSAASFPLMAIPFFIFAGDLMNKSTITERLIDFCKILLEHIRGGLAHSMIVTGTLFAGLTGSAVADTAATIKILGPSMEKEGYPKEFTAALAASTGVLGPIIPPSTIMIVYGATVGTSVGAMFMAGIIPGLLLAALLMVVVSIKAKHMNLPSKAANFSLKRILIGLKDAALALVMPIIIIVGIRGGVFTPTEGGAVAVAYSLIIGIFVFRALTFKDIFRSAIESAITSAVIMMVVSASSPFGWIVAICQGPVAFAEFITSVTDNTLLIVLFINLLLLFVGMFLEGAAIVLLLAPIFAPLAASIGMDPVHFAIIMTVNVCIGMITPPMGVNLFVAGPVAGVSMTRLSRAILPFLAVELVGLICITCVPQLSLWLPNLVR